MSGLNTSFADAGDDSKFSSSFADSVVPNGLEVNLKIDFKIYFIFNSVKLVFNE
jgi:hypothetical protein